MNFFEKLEKAQDKNNSLLCVGLDIDLTKVPKEILKEDNPILAFNKAIIDATKEHVCAYKPNFAFYEQYGISGLEALKQTIEYIPDDIPVIGDAKRGDIGNTSKAYAKAVFEEFNCDSITVNPYMGHDSYGPFLSYKDKGIFILCLTSNPGSQDFQTPGSLYLKVADEVKKRNEHNNCGLVVGATHPEKLKGIREAMGDMTFLLPGIGKQGGDVKAAIEAGLNSQGKGLVINSSRAIIYASTGSDFAEAAGSEALKVKNLINENRGE